MNTKKIKLNKAQYQLLSMKPNQATAIWGRGTGKSYMAAHFILNNIHNMPRSNGAIVGASFKQLLQRVIPSLISSWADLGYYRDQHFVIGRKAPKKLGFASAYIEPILFDYYIQWYNGAGIYLVSQSVEGSSNGLSIDWIYGDEAKFLKKDKLDNELLPTLRGNRQYFEHLACYQSILYTSDMPTTKEGLWLLENKNKNSSELNELLVKYSEIVEKLKIETVTAKAKHRIKLEADFFAARSKLEQLRKKSYLYSSFSSYENIEILGENTLKKWKREMLPMIYQTSVLNLPLTTNNQAFYPNLDHNKHYYSPKDGADIDFYGYDYSRDANTSCEYDKDIDTNKPLDIACDYGASINVLVVGQEHRTTKLNEYRFVNAFYKTHPSIIQEVVQAFCDYYSAHRNKLVNYYFDHTAVAHYSNIKATYADTVIDVLKKNGWKVNKEYYGQAPRHELKYDIWYKALASNGDDKLPLLRFNRVNAHWLITSLENTECEDGKQGVQKNKKEERNSNSDQRGTTHFSDACDMLLYGRTKKHGKTGENSISIQFV